MKFALNFRLKDEDSPAENPQPSLTRVHQVFKAFGDVRIVDIPMLDEKIA